MTPENVTALTSAEISKEWEKAIAEGERLHASKTRTEDEETRLGELTNVLLPKFEKDFSDKIAEEKIVASKERMKLPTRAAAEPNLYSSFGKETNEYKARNNEGFAHWLNCRCGNKINTGDAYKARSAGFDLDNTRIDMEWDWNRLIENSKYKSRQVLNTGSSGYGAEWVYTNFQQQVVDYLLQSSPLLSMINIETVDNPNPYKFYVRDDTALLAVYTDSETSPTISDVAVATDVVTINMFELNTGYQKFTRAELQKSAVDVQGTVAKACANSMKHKLEKEVIQAAAANSAAIGGIVASATQSGSDVEVSDLAVSHFEDLYYDIPAAYRDDAIIITSDTGAKKLFQKAKDGVNRSLLSKLDTDPPTVERFKGMPVVSSYWGYAYTAGNKVYCAFSNRWYKLLLTKSNPVEILTDKFHPLIAGYMDGWAGGKFFGPSGSARFIKVVADAP